jgi:HD-GYP domain-containing protein (c-di-GMP phosphodiesterase class II)
VSRGLGDEFAERVFLFAPLHDIGKIGVPDSILQKPGALDAAERRVMETHVTKGCDVLDKVISHFGLHNQADAAIMRNIVACHHELLDGSGYPHRLAGDAIPIEARVVTVADIFDALTSTRPYKAPWSVRDALAELARMAQAGKLDAGCVAALTRHSAAASAIIAQHQDHKIAA